LWVVSNGIPISHSRVFETAEGKWKRMNGFDMPVPLTRAGQKYRTELECAAALGLVE
jgi:hypothetical protein